jgi:ribulose-phosphate 3-epimerase
MPDHLLHPGESAPGQESGAPVWRNGCLIAPSLLSFDLCNLERDVEAAAEAGLQALHVDVIDGHFSPSLPLGIETIAQLRRRTNLAFDVHVMTARHDYFVDALLDIGVQQLSFHIETEPHAERLIDRIHRAGARAGVALKPATSLATLDYVLESCDTVLLMLINPGFAGRADEAQVPYAARKIEELCARIKHSGAPTSIEIDGRVSPDIIRRYAPSGVDVFVAGSACIARDDRPASLRRLAELSRSLARVQ